MNQFIEFPALGWHFSISDVIVQFSLFGLPVTIRWYGLLIALGLMLAILYAFKRADQFDVDRERMLDVVIVSVLFAFIGARLYYILFSGDLDFYLANPIRMLQVWQGGLAIYGGIIFAFLSALIMCKIRKVNPLGLFDLASLGFLIGQGIGRWGNFFNQEAFGGNTTLPWGMTGSGILVDHGNVGGYDTALPVHPTFFYEFLWCLLGFILLHIISKKAYKFKGQIFSLYLIWYGVGRFFIESLRTDSLYLGTMRVSQLISVLGVLLGVCLFFFFKARHNRLPDTLIQPVLEESAEDETESDDVEADGFEEELDSDTLEEEE